MKIIYMILIVVLVGVLSGCDNKSETGGSITPLSTSSVSPPSQPNVSNAQHQPPTPPEI